VEPLSNLKTLLTSVGKKYFGKTSVKEPHLFYAVPVPLKIFDAASAPAPTLLNSKVTF
jgi:hypothetical protein